MPHVLRYVAAFLLAGWLGAVIFFGAVVVPVAHDVLQSHREIGFVTRRVTGVVNIVGAAAVAVLALYLAGTWNRRPRSGRAWALSTLAVLVLAQAALFVLRARLDALLDPEAMRILDRARFMWLHERYLNVTTVLCLAGAVHLWTLLSGISSDRRVPPPPAA